MVVDLYLEKNLQRWVIFTIWNEWIDCVCKIHAICKLAFFTWSCQTCNLKFNNEIRSVLSWETWVWWWPAMVTLAFVSPGRSPGSPGCVRIHHHSTQWWELMQWAILVRWIYKYNIKIVIGTTNNIAKWLNWKITITKYRIYIQEADSFADKTKRGQID